MKPHSKKHTEEEVIAAITGACGIKKTIARRLHVHRNTLDRYLVTMPAAGRFYQEEMDGIGDMVEEVILDAIRAGDTKVAMWYASHKLRDRGYAERQEVTGADGADLRLFVVLAPPPEETKEEWVAKYQHELAGNGKLYGNN